MADLIANERIKLVASAFDRLSTTLAGIGVITPFVTLVYGSGTISLAPQFSAVAAACWLMAALSLHLLAQQVLGALKDDRS
ncbi:MAG TPA: hypothetical protein VHA07_15075 [Devosia sp.]|nr:hypothetical protein [Devosia sp.]